MQKFFLFFLSILLASCVAGKRTSKLNPEYLLQPSLQIDYEKLDFNEDYETVFTQVTNGKRFLPNSRMTRRDKNELYNLLQQYCLNFHKGDFFITEENSGYGKRNRYFTCEKKKKLIVMQYDQCGDPECRKKDIGVLSEEEFFKQLQTRKVSGQKIYETYKKQYFPRL